jgi:hypothetical protein
VSEAYDLYQLGRARLREGMAAQATVPLEKARRLEPEKASIREALGIAYFRITDWHSAEREFRKVLELSPVDDYAHYALGRSLLKQGRRAPRSLRGADVRFRRGRFQDLVERQLDLFAADDAELLDEALEAEAAYDAAEAGEAEEAYGDYQLVVDAIADRLLDIRESYAHTLDEDAAAEYSAEFTRAATKRFRRYATLLADLEED